MKSKGGRALLALRENPRVASTFGINVTQYTLFAFVLSGVFAGLGGALLAHNNTQVSSVGFDFQLALIFIIMTVVGGLKSRPGIVIGSCDCSRSRPTSSRTSRASSRGCETSRAFPRSRRELPRSCSAPYCSC